MNTDKTLVYVVYDIERIALTESILETNVSVDDTIIGEDFGGNSYIHTIITASDEKHREFEDVFTDKSGLDALVEVMDIEIFKGMYY